ncbi:hypothetical protein NEDG_01422 [Nematocida displodere]|uniref:Uncharacterized protein n=1 Tax=Nematocida displodere TaxID=1805483 RepID=A0A177EED0_9MICR|nr:hypothetical protein NEDG_01422 [Nematocida displodere]
MDKRTPGGRKKLVFTPKMPSEPSPSELEPEIKQKEEVPKIPQNPALQPQPKKQKPFQKKPEAPLPVALAGGTREELFRVGIREGKEILSEDLQQIEEDAPITLEGMQARSTTYTSTSTIGQLGEGARYLLQLPGLLPEEGSTLLHGQVTVREGCAFLSIRGRRSAASAAESFTFSLSESFTSTLPQEAFFKNGAVLQSEGAIHTKLISSDTQHSSE